MDLETVFVCETCHDTGEIDETLGGIGTSNPHAPCPDCTAPVPVYVYIPCICKQFGRLRLVNLQCRAHSASVSEDSK